MLFGGPVGLWHTNGQSLHQPGGGVGQSMEMGNSEKDTRRFRPRTLSARRFRPDAFGQGRFRPETLSAKTLSAKTLSARRFRPTTLSARRFRPRMLSAKDAFGQTLSAKDAFGQRCFRPTIVRCTQVIICDPVLASALTNYKRHKFDKATQAWIAKV